MATIDNLTLEITANSSKALNDLKKLGEALSSIKTASNIKGENLQKVADGFASIRIAISTLQTKSITKVNNLADALERVASVDGGALSSVAKAISKIDAGTPQKKVKEAVSKQLPAVIPSAGTPEVVKNLPSVISEASSGMSAVGSSGLDEAKEQADGLYGSFKEIKDVTEGLQRISIGKYLSKDLQSLKTAFKQTGVMKAFRQELEHLGGIAKKVTEPIRYLFRSIGRIALYRAIRSAIKEVTQATKEGIDNLAIYSKSLNSKDSAKANETMSKLATAFLYLKNSIASAVMPIIQQFTPAVVKMTDIIVGAVNAVNQLISALQGKSTFTKAKNYWVDYADSLDKATGRAKALHHQLAGFDELNNLTANSGSGSGNELDPTQMFEEALIDNKFLEVASKIKENFEDILGIVGLIGAGIGAWALSTTLLNGLGAFGTVGKIASAGISIGVALWIVGTGLEWKGFLDSLKEGLSTKVMLELSIGSGLGLAGAGTTSLFGGGIAGLLMSAIMPQNFALNWLSPLLVGMITVGAPLFATGFFNMIKEGVSSANTMLVMLGAGFVFSGLFALIGGLAGPLGTIAGLVIGGIVGPIVGGLTALLVYITQNFDKIRIKTTTFLRKWGLNKMADKVDEVMLRIQPFFEDMDGLLKGLGDKATEMSESFSKALDVLVETGDVKQAWETLKTSFTDSVKGMKDELNKFKDNIKRDFNPTLDEAKKKVGDLANKFDEWREEHPLIDSALRLTTSLVNAFNHPLQTLIDTIFLTGVNLKDLSKKFEETRSKGSSVKDWFANNNPFKKVQDNTVEFIAWVLSLKTELQNTQDKGSAIKTWFANNPIFKKAEDSATAFKSVLDKIKSVLDALKNFKIDIPFGLNFSSNGNDGGSGLKDAVGDAVKEVTNKTDDTKKTPKNPYTGHSIARARGGYVPRGDLFIANERTPEMIGSIGGNTAVANNNQITEAIATATYNAMARALSENGQNVNIVVEGDGDKMFKVFQKKQRDWQRTTGLAY